MMIGRILGTNVFVLTVVFVATGYSVSALAGPQLVRSQQIADARWKIGEAFSALDSNRDGQMTRTELLGFTAPRNIRDHRLLNHAVWKRADSNRNGTISRSEFLNAAIADYVRDIDARRR